MRSELFGTIKNDIGELDNEIASHETRIDGAIQNYIAERYAKMVALKKKLITYRNYLENITNGRTYEPENAREYKQAIGVIGAQIDKTSFLMSELSEYDWHIKENVDSLNTDIALELLGESVKLQKTIENECSEIFEVCDDVVNEALTSNIVNIMKNFLEKNENGEPNRD